MAGPTILVTAPVRVERTGGIRQAATFREETRLAASEAVVFQSDGCTFPQISEHLCYAGEVTPDEKTYDSINNIDGIAPPFALYAGTACYLGPDPDQAERSRRTLEGGEDRELEDRLSEWASAGTNVGDSTDLVDALARIEQDLDDNYVSQGVIMVSRGDAVRLDAAGALHTNLDGSIVTINGTPVIASGRHSSGTILGVGAITVIHDTIAQYDVVNPETNTRFAIAERVYAIAVDCLYRVYSTVDVTP